MRNLSPIEMGQALVRRALIDEEDAAALGLFRIAVGLILTLSVLSHVGAVGAYFSDESVIAGRFTRIAFPNRASFFLPPREDDVGWFAQWYTQDPTWVRVWFGVGVLAHVGWTVGLFTRLSGLLSFGLWVSLYGRNPLLYAYPDQLCVVFAFLLMLMPAGRGLSLDARWRGKGGGVPVWCRRILMLQLAIVYTATGLEKSGPTWGSDGTALYYTLANPYNRHFDLTQTWAALQPWVLRPATWAVKVWEVAFGAFVVFHWLKEAALRHVRWFPDLRWIFLGFGVLMHLLIQLALYTVWFSPLMIASYACFLRPNEARALARRLTPPRWRASAEAGA